MTQHCDAWMLSMEYFGVRSERESMHVCLSSLHIYCLQLSSYSFPLGNWCQSFVNSHDIPILFKCHCDVLMWQNLHFQKEPFQKENLPVTLKASIKTLTFHWVWSDTSWAGCAECRLTLKVHTRPRHLIIDQSGLERWPKKRKKCHFLSCDHSS